MLPRNAVRLILLVAIGLTATACVSPATVGPPPAAPTPASTVPSNAPAALQPTNAPAQPEAPAGADPWSRVKSEGRLVVAVSADYPPFAYYNDQHRLDGFDVALIKKIGEKLGLTVDIQDQAFDGIFNALRLGAFDAGIAAITVTPERQLQVDFTDVYYAGQDAVLARNEDAAARVQTPRDMAGKRVGVQRGTIYETWARENLLDTGLIKPEGLHVYTDSRLAVDDLRNGQIDFVLLDMAPARAFAGQGGVKVAGERLQEQLYAIAVPQGAVELKAALNKALHELQDEGVVSELGNQYFGLPADQQAPLPLTASTSAPVPAPKVTPTGCINAMMIVDDLNYDDQAMTDIPVVAPGQPIHKGWRLLNTGECMWDPAYTLSYVEGDKMGAAETRLTNVVGPRSPQDVYVDFKAPAQPGDYQGIWQLRDGRGKPFGQRLDVTIKVSDGAPANDGAGRPAGTPTATQK